MKGEAKAQQHTGTTVSFVKDIAWKDGALMKLCHCVDTEIDADTGNEVRVGVGDRWIIVQEIPETSE